MAFSTTETPTEHSHETQETMFESAAEFPGHDLNESEVTELGHNAQVSESSDTDMIGSLTEDAAYLTDFEDYDETVTEDSPRESALHTVHDFEGHQASLEPSHIGPGAVAGAKVTAASPAYPNPDPDPAPEPDPTPDPDPEPPNLPLTISDFAALEDRVLRAVNLVRRERQARIAAEELAAQAEERAGFQEGRATAAEARALALDSDLQQLQGQAPAVEQLHQEIDGLRQEREQVRQRVERLLSQLDALEL